MSDDPFDILPPMPATRNKVKPSTSTSSADVELSTTAIATGTSFGDGAHILPSKQGGATAPAYRPDIDGMRAVAVIAVIAFHFDETWLPGGFVGVDVRLPGSDPFAFCHTPC